MDGLTNIIEKIGQQNDADCKAVLENANKKAEEILAQANVDAKAVSDSILKAADEKIKIIDAKAVSSSELEYKRVILQKKSEILDDVLMKAVSEICSLDDASYFELIEKLVTSNALVGEGTLRMSDKDIKRLPLGFEEKLATLLSEGKKIVVSKTPFECGGGAVIEYPEIRIDCSIASLVEDKKDEIRDEINKVLFA